MGDLNDPAKGQLGTCENAVQDMQGCLALSTCGITICAQRPQMDAVQS